MFYQNPMCRALLATIIVSQTFFVTGAIAEPVQHATPLGNIATWIVQSDYPQQARLERKEGTAGYRVDVSRTGNVLACEITSTSGSVSLDEATCDHISERGSFSPARDANGNPVQGRYSGRVRWVLPVSWPSEPVRSSQLLPRDFIVSFVVEEDGTIGKCQIERQETLRPVTESPAIRYCNPSVRTTPYLDDQGRPRRMRVRIYDKITVEPAF